MTTVLVDERISPECERRLLTLGFYPIKLPPLSELPEAIASHPDTLTFKLGRELLTSADLCDRAPYVFTELRERHPDLRIHFADVKFGKRYPEDTRLNALVMGDKIFARAASISEKIKELAKLYGCEIINVKQGYPACATLKISDTIAITSDAGMARNLEKCNVKVTKIGTEGVLLPPYEYGFIGGASGVYKDKVYFFGSLSSHPNGDIIREAIEVGGLSPVSLSDGPLTDLGGMIFID